MCTVFVAWQCRADMPLIVLANRDEFYARDAAGAVWWPNGILAGQDLQQQGTWLGVNRQGTWAALTNVRGSAPVLPNAPSRGQLVVSLLDQGLSWQEAQQQLQATADQYNGFNIITGQANALNYYSSTDASQDLKPGVYGLSNARLNTPWPKVVAGKAAVEVVLQNHAVMNSTTIEELLALMQQEQQYEDALLPDTGVGLPMERFLSSLYISSPVYGTRCTTLYMVTSQGDATFIERSYAPNKVVTSHQKHTFKISN